MKIRSFNHVGITVSNFEEALKWYNKYFGFQLICYEEMDKSKIEKLYNLYKLENNPVRFGLLRGPKGAVVEIFEFSNQSKGDTALWNTTGITHLTLDVKNVPRAYEELKYQGIEFLCEPQETNGTCWVFLKDMDGNMVELIDLKSQYFLLKKLGGIASYIMRKKQFKRFYEDK